MRARLGCAGFACLLALGPVACTDDDANLIPDADADAGIRDGVCAIAHGAGADDAGDAAPDSLAALGCRADFEALASEPLDDSIPGARSVKVVLDRLGGDALYFQNSTRYAIHYDFASAQLSGGDLPLVTSFMEFNATEYYSPDRRFVLGAVTHYEDADIWALELAPYDTASPELLEQLYFAVRDAAFFGRALVFHPGSANLQQVATELDAEIPIKTTAEIYAGLDYQPLNLGHAVGKLRFVSADALATEYVNYREIIVLDRVPNDISVVAALITEEFQTPLAHVNVLAQNRKTPNMGLRNATRNETLRALEGKWVKLEVDAFDWRATEVSRAQADAFWEEHKPQPVTLPEVDLSARELRDIEDVTAQVDGEKVAREAIASAARAYGAKAANYSVLARTEGVPTRKAFGIPAFYYMRFMQERGFFARVDALLSDAAFLADPAVRDQQLGQLRDDIEAAAFDGELEALLRAKLDADYPGQSMRFRSSTNAEDLDGFPCAGCYDSHTGEPSDWEGDMLRAIKQTWATVWKFRTFEERAYHSIDHKSVGMALLVHHNFPDEEANGVAITSNPYDPQGQSPGFYVNVQVGGEAEVVAPPPGVTSDSFIYQYSYPNTPIIPLTHSNLIDEGTTVLDELQVHALGEALQAVHTAFRDAYGPGAGNQGWYAMDVEFKFDDEAAVGQPPTLYIKQARPYAGRGR